MHIKKDILYLFRIFLKVVVLHKRIPLVVSWKITERCNYRCQYCGYGQGDSSVSELTTEEVFKIIDQLSLAGTGKIGFTGGEPLIRDDFGDILEYCFKRGISVGVNTNGSLIKKHLQKLGRLKMINLSLDGPKDINDSIRGKGSFDKVMEAIKIAREKDVDRIELTAVLSKANVNSIEYLLNLAQSLKVNIIFQPATRIVLGGNKNNPLALSGSELRKAIAILLRVKHFNKYNLNSTAGLRYLLKYPNFPAVRCARGQITARLGSDGSLYMCDRNVNFKNQKTSVLKVGFNKAWANLKPSICNSSCDCAKVIELNLALGFHFKAVLNALRLY